MTTTPEQFQLLLAANEGSRLEFKSAKGEFHFDELVNYCVALANEGGGKILLGVTDRRPRSVVGSAAFAEPGRTEAGLFQRLGQRIPVEEFVCPAGRVVIVHVPGRMPGRPWQHRGRYLKRAGDELAALGHEELRIIFAEAGPDFSADICARAQLADLDPAALAEFRARWAKKSSDPRKLEWDDRQTLSGAELLVDGQLNYAALILFGSHAALGRHLAQAEVVFEYRSGESAGPAQDREEYRSGFFAFHDALWSKINLRNDRQSYQDGLFRLEIPTFDEQAVREALLNAVSHRDYSLGASVFVRQFARRLEVVSPGGFPVGITPENILEQQHPRNRRVAEVFAKCGLVERSGQGANIMFERAVRQSKVLPSYAGSAAHEVRLTLEGTVRNPAFVRFIERLGEERLRTFSTHDFVALDHLQRDVAAPASLRDRLPGLLESGAIEAVGRGRGTRHILSRSMYAELGAKGTYTRKRGLDHETNKALLEKHLRDSTTAGAPLAELCQVLPALSESAVQRLLNELRAEGRGHVVGKRRWARWHMGPAKAQVVSG